MFEFLVIFLGIAILFMLGLVKRALDRLRNAHEDLTYRIDAMSVSLEEMAEETSGQESEEIGSVVKTDSLTRVREPVAVEALDPETDRQVLPPPLPPEYLACGRDLSHVPDAVEEESVADVETEHSGVTETVREILARIWNWILVGQEYRSPDVTAEYAIASTWLLRLGVLAIVMCLGFFLMWSIQRQLIGPAGRVAIGVFAGGGLLLWGLRLVGRKYHLFAQGFLGGGILVLYFSMYAAGPVYGVVSMPIAYGLMVAVTLTAGILAVRADSLLIAVLGLAGGFLTPVMLKTETPRLAAFYGYMFVLNLGIFGVAFRRNWRLLNYLGFLFTYVLFVYSLLTSYEDSDFVVAMLAATGYFVIHSSLVYIYSILRGEKSTILEILHMVANAVVYSLTGYYLIRDAYGKAYPAILTICLAVFFVAHVLLFLRKKREDRLLLLTLLGLAAVFTTATLPIVFEKESLTIAFSLQALLFLWLGNRVSSNFMVHLAYLLYAVVFVRLLVMDMPHSFIAGSGQSTSGSLYWREFFDRLWTFGVSIGSIIVAFRVVLIQKRRADGMVSPANDVPDFIKPSLSGSVFYWASVLFVFLFLHCELNAMFRMYDPLRLPVLTLLWCGMAVYFFLNYLAGRHNSFVMLSVMLFFVCGAVLKLFTFDMFSWEFTDRFFYGGEYLLLDAWMRLLDFGFVVALLAAAWSILMRRNDRRSMIWVFGYGALLVFFMYVTLEVNNLLYWRLRGFQAGGVSAVWAVFAICFIAAGTWKNIRPLRYAGLCLFGVVALKVMLFDLRGMEAIYRVIAFMVIGVALLLGSFTYMYSSGKFVKNDSQPEERSDDEV